MGRLRILALILALFALLALPVSAATGATRIQGQANVTTKGSCQVNLTIGLHLDSSISELYFPLSLEAHDILLNGSRPSTRIADGAIRVKLPISSAGDHTITIQYELSMVLAKEGQQLYLHLPILNRFPYPISMLEMTVALPGNATGRPEFISGYHQSDTDLLMGYSLSGNTIQCFARETLKDHETLTMVLQVDESMFPGALRSNSLFSTFDGAALCLAILAIFYYLLTLLPRVHRRTRCYCAPDGISAGEVGTCLTGHGTDLTMMVMTWAQAGYIYIEMDLKGRVLLHKRMDMGNERSQFEISCFQSLFSKRVTVDGTGHHYALLCRKLQKKSPMLRQFFLPRSGNPKIFRLLCCAAAGCSGISLAIFWAEKAVWQVLLGIAFGVLCFGIGFLIQSGGKSLPMREKAPLWISLICGLIWLAAGSLADAGSVAPMVFFQFFAGFAAAFGGKRSELGARSLSQLWGLRHYMRKADTFELQRLLQVNPNYFYELAPYALAMGVDKQFAKRFGKIDLPDCSFLATPLHKDMTPVKWMVRLREAADALNARQKRLPYEKLLGRR